MRSLRSALIVLGALGALVLCCAAPALALEPAGDGWYWQSPQPQGRWLNGVAMPDAQHAWAVGVEGTVLSSTDGGATWRSQQAPTTDPLAAAAFTDSLHGCAVGGWQRNPLTGSGVKTSVILFTSDGGATWSAAAQPSEWALTGVVFTDVLTGVAVGQHGTILRTTDGGATWQAEASGTKADLTGVAFTDPLHGYVIGEGRTIVRTKDGGLTWKASLTRRYYLSYGGGLAADGSGTLWAAADEMWQGSRLVRSSDGGRTWKDVTTGSDHPVWAVAASGATICAVATVVSGDDSQPVYQASSIVVSDDGGSAWSSHLLGRGVLTGAVAIGGTSTICAVGEGTVTSSDAGATWSGAAFAPSGVGQLDFTGPLTGWSTTGDFFERTGLMTAHSNAMSSILHTTDGVTWQEQYSTTKSYFLDVGFADDQDGWAVGTRGTILRTVDAGATWTAQAPPGKAVYSQVQAPGAQDAWVLGRMQSPPRKDFLLRTVDGGTTWSTIALPARFWPMAMYFVTRDEGWAVGWGRTGMDLIHTTDGGASWTRLVLSSGLAGASIPIAMHFTDSSHGWIAAYVLKDDASIVLRTSDGGGTWTVTGPEFPHEMLTGVDFVDGQHGWVAGESVWSTGDGGATWQRSVDRFGQMADVAAFDSTHAWAAAQETGIVSTLDGSGDTAPPTTISDGERGWLRTGTSISLSASDPGGSAVAGTEYRVNEEAWQPYVAPLDFPAPADHSGDGRHVVEYRSTDNAGLVEPVQAVRVDVDTIRPVIRLRPSKVGRDGVMRLHLRIDDASCPSISEFELTFRDLRGQLRMGGSYSGFRLPMNRWFTFRERHMQIYDGMPGVYQVSLFAVDRAGNKPAKVGSARLVVKKRASRRRAAPLAGHYSVSARGAHGTLPMSAAMPQTASMQRLAMPAWLSAWQRKMLARLAKRVE